MYTILLLIICSKNNNVTSPLNQLNQLKELNAYTAASMQLLYSSPSIFTK